jgi:hypothetical protein
LQNEKVSTISLLEFVQFFAGIDVARTQSSAAKTPPPRLNSACLPQARPGYSIVGPHPRSPLVARPSSFFERPIEITNRRHYSGHRLISLRSPISRCALQGFSRISPAIDPGIFLRGCAMADTRVIITQLSPCTPRCISPGSIPACAGEPMASRQFRTSTTVYPA